MRPVLTGIIALVIVAVMFITYWAAAFISAILAVIFWTVVAWGIIFCIIYKPKKQKVPGRNT
jgi:hypothetical protein